MIHAFSAHTTIKKAYSWVCARRKLFPATNDIWSLRREYGDSYVRELSRTLLKGNYTFSPVEKVMRTDGTVIHIFSAQDSLVLKAIALVLEKHLRKSDIKVRNLKGSGGSKGPMRAVKRHVELYGHVLKSDVADYYASIDHNLLRTQLESIIPCKETIRLISLSLKYTSTYGGLFSTREIGIPRGSPLSPVLGALFLLPLDKALNKNNVFYTRYMDDYVVLANTRHQLRQAVKTMYKVLEQLKLTVAKAKTYIGKTSKGFDFLGYHVVPKKNLSIASKTVAQCVSNISRLYEHGASKDRIGKYMKHFVAWARGGVKRKLKDIDVYNQISFSLPSPPRVKDDPCRVKHKTKRNEKCVNWEFGFVSSLYLV
jgi:hypothetical protein